jgi:hypothetical protein
MARYELKSLINTLVSEAGEEYVAGLVPIAKAFFHSVIDREILYFNADISSRLKRDFALQLGDRPPGADTRENPTYTVQEPAFLRKEDQRVYWVSRIRVAARAYRTLDPQVFTLESFIINPDPFAETTESMRVVEDVGTSLGFRQGIQPIVPEGTQLVI